MNRAVVDANIFLRLADSLSPQQLVAAKAVKRLLASRYRLRSFNQTSFEFWVAATRPTTANGLGLSVAECERELTQLLARFPRLRDRQDLFPEWQRLVFAQSVKGKPAHDARYVAGMITHGIREILTFNVSDFTRFPGITVLDPNLLAVGVP